MLEDHLRHVIVANGVFMNGNRLYNIISKGDGNSPSVLLPLVKHSLYLV